MLVLLNPLNSLGVIIGFQATNILVTYDVQVVYNSLRLILIVHLGVIIEFRATNILVTSDVLVVYYSIRLNLIVYFSSYI